MGKNIEHESLRGLGRPPLPEEVISDAIKAITAARSRGETDPAWAQTNLNRYGISLPDANPPQPASAQEKVKPVATEAKKRLPQLAISFNIPQDEPERPGDKRKGVFVGDRVIKIHAIEWDMLRYLVDNQGRLVPRAELVTEPFQGNPPADRDTLKGHANILAGRVTIDGKPLISVETNPVDRKKSLGIDQWQMVPAADVVGIGHASRGNRFLHRRHPVPKSA